MDCHYHPGRESVTSCAVCGKSVCGECAMEIAGKTYCKDCLEKIIGMSEPNIAPTSTPSNNPISDTLQGMDSQHNEYDYYEQENPYNQQAETREQIIGEVFGNKNTQQQYDNSVYDQNNFDNPQSPQGYADPYSNQNYAQEPPYYQEPSNRQNYPPVDNIRQPRGESYYPPQDSQYPQYQDSDFDDGYIYPDHSYQPPENPNIGVENKYESYLDDLYFDEPELPLSEQIAKDEATYGSLTKSPYEVRERVNVTEQFYEDQGDTYNPYMPPSGDYQAEGFVKINNVQNNNPQGDFIPQRPPAPQESIIKNRQSPRQRGKDKKDSGMRPATRSIHNIRNMETEKEPYGAVDILLTIILVILIIIVVFYIIYLLILSSSYPTFLDAIMGLSDPGTFFGNLFGSK